MKKADPDLDVSKTIGVDQPSGRITRMMRWIVAVVAGLAIAAAVIFWMTTSDTDSTRYETQKVQRGDLTVRVTATGTLEPTNQVDVGSELSGIVKSVEVDYNARVKKGQILAKLDTEKLEAQVLQLEAALESAQAKVLETEATVMETRNELDRLRRTLELNPKGVSQHALDAADAAFKRAQANEATARAQITEAKAKLSMEQTSLAKAMIRSPISGIVLKRSVEPGQTVAAALQSPVLFTLAEDLTRMDLQVDVDEADVGHVKEGQEATFTVDAYPSRTFPARVTQVRYGSETVDGVVTYKAVLNVANADLSLRQGMTATADIIVKKVNDVLLIPNAALRFTPPTDVETPSTNGGGLVSRLLPRPPVTSSNHRQETNANGKRRNVWVLREGKPVAVPVAVGETDGTMTEVLEGDLEPGIELVVDAVSGAK